jgi:hypothetical protein
MIALLCFFLTLFTSPFKSKSRASGVPKMNNATVRIMTGSKATQDYVDVRAPPSTFDSDDIDVARIHKQLGCTEWRKRDVPKAGGLANDASWPSAYPSRMLAFTAIPPRRGHRAGVTVLRLNCSHAGLECGAAPSRCKSPRKKITMTCPTSASGHVARPPVLIGGPPHAATSYNMHPCDAPAPAAGRPHKPIPLASRRSDRSCAGSTTDARWR